MSTSIRRAPIFPVPMHTLASVDWHYQFRLTLLGDSTVGKTSLVKRYTEGQFSSGLPSTVGVEYYIRMLQVEPGVRVKLQIWDTAGQERFRSMTRSFYRNIIGIMLVFDKSNRKSFEHVENWYREANEYNFSCKVVFMLIGHKSDLETESVVPRGEAEAFASSLGMAYFETSAQNNSNVDAAFEFLMHQIYSGLCAEAHPNRDGWEGVKLVYRITKFTPRRKKAEPKCQC
ncbi:ras-related protein Rab-39B-like [Microcaecilia unicolor]|uniref:Ras-related protein Rab-39B-like n=1 Tax=Microcaecilia unicolor TaxID=1415580 RepID=A0A6P7Z954_9AMPH|nr:ras-related protein Rab-39B-like [Microcaecilia unicolor]